MIRRTEHKVPVPDGVVIKDCLLGWAQAQTHFAWLDSNGHQDPLGRFEAILAMGVHSRLESQALGAFQKLSSFRDLHKDWVFGYLGYDLKNDLEDLKSSNPDRMRFPDLYFFQPEKIIELRSEHVIFHYLPEDAGAIADDWKAIIEIGKRVLPESRQSTRIRMGMFKDAYFQGASRLLDRIRRGDIYEVNFCQEFYARIPELNPFECYRDLNGLTEPPFSGQLRFGERFLMSASPERFLRRRGEELYSQPMKGTAARDPDPLMDRKNAMALGRDPKERSENIMITDLVRNDLSKSALRGSVQVEELCEVKTYRQVHQMVSTVSARVPKNADPIRLIQESFPMGSMTGAPKISAMKLIENEENFKRGVYSGALGYLDPLGDFDFNVVIRSVLYNAESQWASFAVGSALTSGTDPEREYMECLLKARAMKQVLEGDIT